MSEGALRDILRQVQRMAGPSADPRTDGQLLEQFVTRCDEAAFAALLERHGPMVLGVCTRVLRHEQDAEDAFQATFLVLARKAGSVPWRGSIGGYLYRVASRLALRARAKRARRLAHEREAGCAARPAPSPEAAWEQLSAVLDEELNRLPEKYRAPLMLCCLEGKTRDEAAEELGWTVGAVKGRLERGRELLRSRLRRRGLPLSGALLTTFLMQKTGPAAVPARLVDSTARAGAAFAARAAGAPITDTVRSLAEESLKGVFLGKLRLVAAVVLVLAATGVGAGLLAYHPRSAERPPTPEAPAGLQARAATGDARRREGKELGGRPEQSPVQTPRVRADRYGDPLPPGAVARLGTVRLLHPGRSESAAFSPDGKVLASGGRDGAIRLWDPATGRQLRRLVDQGAWFQALAFSPDGKTLASMSRQRGREILLWDTATGKTIRSLPDRSNGMQMLAFAPDGKRLATSGWDGTVLVRETATGKELLRIKADKGGAHALAYSPDGRTLASGGSMDSVVRLWDAATGKDLRQFRGHGQKISAHRRSQDPSQGVPSVAFSPDGKMLASGGYDCTVRLWDVATAREIRLLMASAPVYSVAFAPDGKTLAGGGLGHQGPVRVWEVATGKQLSSMSGGAGQVLAFAPDGKRLAGAGAMKVELWDPATGKDLFPPRGHEGGLIALGFAPDGRTVTSVSLDSTARVWDPATGRELRRVGEINADAWATGFATDGRALTVERQFKSVRLSDVSAGKVLCQVPVSGRADAAACSADGKTLATVSYRDQSLRVWDVATGQQRCMVKGINRIGLVKELAFSPDGRILAAAETYPLRLWDARTGECLGELKVGPVGAMTFTPDGRTLVTGELSGAVRIWDVATGKELRQLRMRAPASVAIVALAPGGRSVAASSLGPGREDFALWDLATGKLLGQLSGHPNAIRAFAFSPDGRTLVLGGEDQTVRIWDAFTGQEIRRFRGHQDWVTALAFAPDGRTLASGSVDGTGLVWDLTASVAAKPAAARQLQALWADLGGADASRADRAFWALVASPKQAVPLLRRRLVAARPSAGPRPGRLLTDLDHDDFAVRQKAEQELARLGERARPALRRALASRPSLEARRRIEGLLARLDRTPKQVSPLPVGTLRALRVLEQIRNAEARAVLQELADRVEDLPTAAEASAALAHIRSPQSGQETRGRTEPKEGRGNGR